MKKVILLASENMCDILQTALDGKYITLPCSDSAAGGALLQTAPDALILELSLPGADGLTFLNNFADYLPDVVLILTSFISDAIIHDLESDGISAVLRIPFRLPYLEKLLSEHL